MISLRRWIPLALIHFALSASAQPIAQSHFDASAEGWTVVALSDPSSGFPHHIVQTIVPDWKASGGSPGGYVENSAQPGSTTVYWSAPPSFRGNRLAAFGGTLQFDAFDSPATGKFVREDVILLGADRSLILTVSGRALPAWTAFSIALLPAQWKVNSLGGPAATAQDVSDVLYDLLALYIRAEFQLGDDTRGLDNVVIAPSQCALVAIEPRPTSVCPTGSANFSVTAAGVSPFTYRWQYESAPDTWVDATNGPIPYSSGTITASNVATVQLQLALNTTHGAPPIRFRCVVTNSCGSATSDPTTLAPCQADFTCDGQVDDADFVGFAAAYNILDCADPAMPANCPADLNGDGFVDDSDFVVFAAAYNELGCL